MILTKILNKLDDEGKVCLGMGIILGIVMGLMVMACNFSLGISFGEKLIAIFMIGFLLTFIVGSFCGLIGFLSFIIPFGFFSVGSLFQNYYPQFIPLWLLLIITFILTEIFFWLTPLEKSKTKKKPKKTYGKTILLKLECLFEVFILLNILNIFRLLISRITPEIFKAIWNWIIHTGLLWAGYIVGGALAICGIIYILHLWIKLNERKFKK